MRTKQGLILSAVAICVALFFIFDLGQYLQLDVLKHRLTEILEFQRSSPLSAALGFFAVYVVVTSLSLPGAVIMTLAGGAVFGFWWGLLLVSFASSLGATLAFLVSRVVLRD